jgi:DnaJ-class molecular chaperone
VKQYHPDANGGNRRYESRLIRITKAYQHLSASWRS